MGPLWLWVFGQAQSPTQVVPPGFWEQYGPIGILAGLLVLVVVVLFRLLMAAYKREMERGDRLERELDARSSADRVALDAARSAVEDAVAQIRRPHG